MIDYKELKLDVLKIIDRIKQHHDVYRDKDVAKILGINERNLAVYKMRNNVPLKRLIKYALKYKVSLDYLFWGKND